MKISQISISISRTINLGNYESLQVKGQCTIDFDEMDAMMGEEHYLPQARKKAIEEVKKQMNEAFQETKPKGK